MTDVGCTSCVTNSSFYEINGVTADTPIGGSDDVIIWIPYLGLVFVVVMFTLVTVSFWSHYHRVRRRRQNAQDYLDLNIDLKRKRLHGCWRLPPVEKPMKIVASSLATPSPLYHPEHGRMWDDTGHGLGSRHVGSCHHCCVPSPSPPPCSCVPSRASQFHAPTPSTRCSGGCCGCRCCSCYSSGYAFGSHSSILRLDGGASCGNSHYTESEYSSDNSLNKGKYSSNSQARPKKKKRGLSRFNKNRKNWSDRAVESDDLRTVTVDKVVDIRKVSSQAFVAERSDSEPEGKLTNFADVYPSVKDTKTEDSINKYDVSEYMTQRADATQSPPPTVYVIPVRNKHNTLSSDGRTETEKNNRLNARNCRMTGLNQQSSEENSKSRSLDSCHEQADRSSYFSDPDNKNQRRSARTSVFLTLDKVRNAFNINSAHGGEFKKHKDVTNPVTAMLQELGQYQVEQKQTKYRQRTSRPLFPKSYSRQSKKKLVRTRSLNECNSRDFLDNRKSCRQVTPMLDGNVNEAYMPDNLGQTEPSDDVKANLSRSPCRGTACENGEEHNLDLERQALEMGQITGRELAFQTNTSRDGKGLACQLATENEVKGQKVSDPDRTSSTSRNRLDKQVSNPDAVSRNTHDMLAHSQTTSAQAEDNGNKKSSTTLDNEKPTTETERKKKKKTFLFRRSQRLSDSSITAASGDSNV